MHFRYNLLLVTWAVPLLLSVWCNGEERLCYPEILGVSSGTLNGKRDVLVNGTCTWQITSPAGRSLFVTVESVHLVSSDAVLELAVDSNKTSLPWQCVDCNISFSGSIITIRYNELGNYGDSSSIAKLSAHFRDASPSPDLADFDLKASTLESNVTQLPHVPGTSLFVMHYTSYNALECDPPSFPINYVPISSEGNALKLGSQVLFSCNSPYTPAQGSLLTATCIKNPTTSLPEWSNPTPRCIIPECDKAPIRFALDDSQSKIVIAQGNSTSDRVKSCVWEITTNSKRHIIAQVGHLVLPGNHWVLEMYDGKVLNSRLLARLSNRTEQTPQTYSTVFNKLIISLHAEVSSGNKAEQPDKNFPYNFTISVASEVSLCKTPILPANGDGKGWKLSPSDDQGDNISKRMVIVYSCNPGYELQGSGRATCLRSRKWNSGAPVCLPLGPILNVAPDNITTVGISKVYTADDISSEKFLPPRPPKNHRPYFQSTEEKQLKASKEDPNSKSKSEPWISTNWEPFDNMTAEDDILPENSGDGPEQAVPSGPFAPQYPYDTGTAYEDPFQYPDEGPDDSTNDWDNFSSTQEIPVMAIILGVGIPVILLLTVGGGCLLYRRLYPVRMGVGRKFETFENPIYKNKKRGTTSPDGSLLPGSSLAHSPAELQRLTVS